MKLFILLLIVSSNAFANHTLAEVNNILNKQQNNQQNNQSAWQNFASPFALKTPINASVYALNNHYTFILFYSASCPHCQRFDPILKQYAVTVGISVKAFTFDGATLPSFPKSTTINRNLVQEYFGANEVALPTLFILNQANLHVYPVAQGELSYLDLVLRMNQLAPKILQFENKFENRFEKKFAKKIEKRRGYV